MALFLTPHLEILPPPQQRLWGELRQIPEEFTLYDGALALRLGHRQSADFNFFGSRDLDPMSFADTIAFLRDAPVVQREKNTYSAVVDRDGPVRVSFFGVPALRRLEEPDVVAANHDRRRQPAAGARRSQGDLRAVV